MTRRKKTMRIGIYGGKFDPIHYGHLLCAEWTRQQYDLDRVLFVTSANPPNKKTGVLPAEERHDMVVASTAENPFFEASRIDLEHGGSGYTLMTVEAVRRQYGDDVELYYLSSSEYLDPTHKWYLPKWVGAKELFKLCKFLIFPRDFTEVQQVKNWAKLIPQADIEVLYVPSPELSSTMIRGQVEKGGSIRYTTPFVVQQMIAKKGIYRNQDAQLDGPQMCTCQRPSEIKSIGIYGGQFDPIHYGHLLAAECARCQFNLDRVLFVTSANPPNNKTAAGSAEARHEMVVAAVSDNPYFEASRIDMDRRTTSYALLTVEQVREMYGHDVALNLLISAEYLDPKHPWYLPKWMGAPALFELVRFLVIPRNHCEIPRIKEWMKLIPEARFDVVSAPVLPVSSNMIRELVAERRSIWYTTPWPVQQMIAKKGLYQKPAPKRLARSRK